MITKDQENEVLLEALRESEAGVMDVFEFYAGVEAVYAASIRALEAGHTTLTSTSANPE